MKYKIFAINTAKFHIRLQIPTYSPLVSAIDSGAKDKTCQVVIDGIISGRLQVYSVEGLAETEIGYLRKVPGMRIPILNDLRSALWRLKPEDKDEAGKKGQTVKPETTVLPIYSIRREGKEVRENVVFQLKKLNLSNAAFNALKRAINNYGLYAESLEDIAGMSDSELLDVRNFGDKYLREFREAVENQAKKDKQP